MAVKQDFEFVDGLAADFFRRPYLKRVLATINAASMTGWEKWLQIELASFLSSHTDVKAWWRESKYELDKRVLDSRDTCAVDFLIHEKWKQSHMALELKQANSPNGCVKAMLRDKKKIAAIKFKKFDIRSVWCLGVHREEDPKEVRRLLAYHADKMRLDVPKNFHSQGIGRTGYAYTIF